MRRVRKSALSIAFLWTLLSVTLLGAASASAAPDPPDVVFTLPAGLACAGFDLQVEIRGGTQVSKEFTDKDGNLRTLAAGKGSEVTYINLETGETFVQKAAGSVTQVTYYPDGSSRWVTTGQNSLILFPSDVPAGPSTTLTAGRVVFTIGTDGVFTVTEISGKTTDICAELST